MNSISEAGSIWTVLGVEATTDTTAIRRAYRARLRTIDVDRDPASFIVLRRAFEDALQWSPEDEDDDSGEWEESAGSESDFEPDAEKPPARGAEPEHPANDAPQPEQFRSNAQDRVSIEAFDRAVKEGKAAQAEPIFNTIMAKGIAGIGDESEFIRRFIRVAAEDLSFPASRLEDLAGRFIAQGFNGAGDGFASLRADVLKRVEADAWYRALRRNADEPWRPFRENRRIRRVARLLLKRRWQSVLLRVHGVTLDQTLAQYRPHAEWIGAAMDKDWIARIERKRKRQIRRGAYLIWAVVALLAADFVYVLGRGLLTGNWN